MTQIKSSLSPLALSAGISAVVSAVVSSLISSVVSSLIAASLPLCVLLQLLLQVGHTGGGEHLGVQQLLARLGQRFRVIVRSDSAVDTLRRRERKSHRKPRRLAALLLAGELDANRAKEPRLAARAAAFDDDGSRREAEESKNRSRPTAALARARGRPA